mmetsp:Transcript_2877/g.5366  ORF Transcript_2877/g.5366 Transcript_2877/m.5366 type:complete len:524 (+) Transcript_2877:37-1608(+)
MAILPVLVLAISIVHHCQGIDYVCSSANPCPATINCPSTESCLVQCAGSSSCQSTTINCNNHCVVQCSGLDSCVGATIDGTSSISLVLQCSQTGSCSDAEIQCSSNTDCSVPCFGASSCVGATIYAANNRNLEVDCQGISACNTLTIQATTAAALTISDCAQERNSCSALNVHCPPKDENGANCILDSLGNSANYDDLEIYAVNGFADITLDETSSTISGTMYCGADFSSSCSMESNTLHCDPISVDKTCDDTSTTVTSLFTTTSTSTPPFTSTSTLTSSLPSTSQSLSWASSSDLSTASAAPSLTTSLSSTQEPLDIVATSKPSISNSLWMTVALPVFIVMCCCVCICCIWRHVKVNKTGGNIVISFNNKQLSADIGRKSYQRRESISANDSDHDHDVEPGQVQQAPVQAQEDLQLYRHGMDNNAKAPFTPTATYTPTTKRMDSEEMYATPREEGLRTKTGTRRSLQSIHELGPVPAGYDGIDDEAQDQLQDQVDPLEGARHSRFGELAKKSSEGMSTNVNS